MLNEEKIKIVLSKCCICDFLLNIDYVISNSKVYCKQCYDSSYKCSKCNNPIGEDYFTIESDLYCRNCIDKYNNI
jgi:hypothetical protein